MTRLNSTAELESMRSKILSERDPERPAISVCAGTGCLGQASEGVIEAFSRELERRDLQGKVDLRPTGCHGFCEEGPIVVLYPGEIGYVKVTPADVPEIVSRTVVDRHPVERLCYQDPATGERAVRMSEIPFYRKQKRLLLGDSPRIDPERIEDYLAVGGYAGLAKALSEMKPEQIVAEIKKANLRGRGGGGFPAGRKWETARNAPNPVKYVIVNAHEGEPGAYMDRALFTGNPHLVLEGLIIGGFAIGAHQGFIYTRHDNPRLKRNIDQALVQARGWGLLGKDILGSGFDLDVEVHYDVGIFVSGESSALMRSIEGRNPEPRPKYIRTSVHGIYDRPSCLNNVETWANVPQIIKNGADWYAGIGTEKSKGTKLISLSGNIANAGVVEVPFGTPLREIVYELGGGIPNGKKLKAVHFGGPMGGSIPASLIDTPLDFDLLSGLGASIGAGGLLVLDEDTNMVEVTRFFLEYLTNEACGKCVPCREGVRQMLKIVTRISQGKGRQGDLELLDEIAEVTSGASLCALGKTASDPLRGALRHFREEYESRIQPAANPGKCG